MSDYLKREPLTDDELDTFVALRRVGGPGGGVAELNGHYYHHGRPMVPWLEGPLSSMVDAGLLTLADPDPESWGLRRATLTATGQVQYEVLCDKQGVPPSPVGRRLKQPTAGGWTKASPTWTAGGSP